MTALYCVLAAIVGFVVWISLTPPPRRPVVADAGRLLYFAGALVTLMVLAREVARLLPGR